MSACYSDIERKAAADLLEENYDLLLGLARLQRRRARMGDTMQTSDVLHDALARLDMARDWNSRQHFVRATNLAIRHVIIDRAREKLTAKRGAGASHLRVEDSEDILTDYGETPEQLVAIGQAMTTLEADHPRWVQIIDARYFAGLTEQECAVAIGLSARTVRREWGEARKWLAGQLDLKHG